MGWLKGMMKHLPMVNRLVRFHGHTLAGIEALRTAQEGLRDECRWLRLAQEQGLGLVDEHLAQLAGVLRTLEFQVREALPHNSILAGLVYRRLRAPNGVRFGIVASRRSEDGITQPVLQGIYPDTIPWALLDRYIRPGGVVLDLGANIGIFALVAAACGCRVIAVEANPENVLLLRASIAANQYRNLEVVHAAVSDRPGTLKLLSWGPYGFIAPESEGEGGGEGGVDVPGRTVDDILAGLGIDRVDLIKMDVEGSEIAALKGMAGLLSRPDAPPVYYESNGHCLHKYRQSCSDLKRLLAEFGYTSYQVAERTLRPVCPEEIQPEVRIDYFASRTPLINGDGWQVVAPLARRDLIDRVLALGATDFAPQREHLSRELSRAPGWLRDNPAVRAAASGLESAAAA